MGPNDTPSDDWVTMAEDDAGWSDADIAETFPDSDQAIETEVDDGS